MRVSQSLLFIFVLGSTPALHAASWIGIPTDKAAHFGLSSVGAEALIKGCRHVRPGKESNVVCHVWGSSIMVGVGVLKEWGDQQHGGQFDPSDLAADILGVITGNLLQWEF